MSIGIDVFERWWTMTCDCETIFYWNSLIFLDVGKWERLVSWHDGSSWNIKITLISTCNKYEIAHLQYININFKHVNCDKKV